MSDDTSRAAAGAAVRGEAEAFDAFARRITDLELITDPWFDGAPRFAQAPVILSEAEHEELCAAGEATAAVIDEAVSLLLDDEAQRRAFLPLPPVQEAMFLASAGMWHGIARADVFRTPEGLQITELNSDTPTGEPEAIVLGRLGKEDHPELADACATLAPRLASMWLALHQAGVDDATDRTAAIIYPTEFTEDLSLVRLYRQLLEELGFRVVLGSPYNLAGNDDGSLDLFGERPSLVLRHYKSDWWGERESVWLDDDVMDHEPLTAAVQAIVRAQQTRRAVMVNPLGAIASQSKRLLAFCWERIHRFSTTNQDAIQRLIPFSSRLETMHDVQLTADKDRWVIKSDYGAEGDEVIIGRRTDDETWRKTIALARPGRFIAQRYFEAERDAQGVVQNFGVFVVGGEACGVYTRRDRGFTDPSALSVPTLVRKA